MTQFNWPVEIVHNCQWMELAVSAAPDVLDPWSPPKVAAKPDAIAAAETAVGFRFPEAYRGFLLHADGWNRAYMHLSLFGTPDFISGRAQQVLKRPGLVELVARMGFGLGQYLPVGAAADPEVDADVFLLIRPESPVLAGGVVWVDSEVISESGRYSSFEEFFMAIVDHNQALAHHAEARAHGPQ